MPCFQALGKGSRYSGKRLQGYTLTEILIVLVIIGLIAAIMVPQTVGQLGRAKSRTAKARAQQIAAALEIFSADVGRYPTAEEGLAVLVRDPGDIEGWDGPYIRTDKQLRDPWGQLAVYQAPSELGALGRVGSLGADAKAGGEGESRDVYAE